MQMTLRKKKIWMAVRLVFDTHLIPLRFRLEIETLQIEDQWSLSTKRQRSDIGFENNLIDFHCRSHSVHLYCNDMVYDCDDKPIEDLHMHDDHGLHCPSIGSCSN